MSSAPERIVHTSPSYISAIAEQLARSNRRYLLFPDDPQEGPALLVSLVTDRDH